MVPWYHGTRVLVPWYTCTMVLEYYTCTYHGTLVPWYGTVMLCHNFQLTAERMQGNTHLHSRYHPHTNASLCTRYTCTVRTCTMVRTTRVCHTPSTYTCTYGVRTDMYVHSVRTYYNVKSQLSDWKRAHMCTENHMCLGRIHGSQLRERANAGQHTPTLATVLTPLPQRRTTMLCHNFLN